MHQASASRTLEFLLYSAHPLSLVLAPKSGCCDCRKVREVGCMAPSRCHKFACVVQAKACVLTEGLEQAEAARRLDQDQRSINHAGNHVGRTGRGGFFADRLDGFDIEGAGEDAEMSECTLFPLIEQVIAPVQRRLERLLAYRHRGWSSHQQPEAVDEARQHLLERHVSEACGGKLQSQRDSVQAAAQLGHGRCILVGQQQGPVDEPGPLDEQPHGVARPESIRPWSGANCGHWQPAHLHDLFTWHSEKLPAGGDQSQVRAISEQPYDGRCAGVEQMLAIVNDSQRLPRRKGVHESIQDVLT